MPIVLGVFRTASTPPLTNGKITVDPDHPNRMIYQNTNNPVCFCGPGDPEDYFHNETMAEHNAFLIGRGARSTYINAWLDDFGGGNPGTGATLDTNIALWLPKLQELDAAGVVINFFFFDDSYPLPATWEADVDAVVTAFKDLKNLIWTVAEEYVEALTVDQVADVAARIKAIDTITPVGCHQNTGTSFAFNNKPDVQAFVIQYNVDTAAEVHAGVLAAYSNTSGQKILNFAEISEPIWHADYSRAVVRQINWAAAMGGASGIQVLGLGRFTDESSGDATIAARNDQERYDDCATLMDFMESINLNVLVPADARAHGDSLWVMAGDGDFLAYGSDVDGDMGITSLPAGDYTLTWLDCISGASESSSVNVPSTANTLFSPPVGYGAEVAMYLELA